MSEDAAAFVRAMGTLDSLFQQAGFRSPEAIVLQSADDGIRLMGLMSNQFSMQMTMFGAPDETNWGEAKIMGIKIRWPLK